MKRNTALLFGLIGTVAGVIIIYLFAKRHGISWDKFWGLATGFLLLSSGISFLMKQGDFFFTTVEGFCWTYFPVLGFCKSC